MAVLPDVEQMAKLNNGYKSRGPFTLLGTLLLGSFIGIITGLLFAPSRGQDTRIKIKQKAQDTLDKSRDNMGDLLDKAKDKVEQTNEKASRVAEAAKQVASEVKEQQPKMVSK